MISTLSDKPVERCRVGLLVPCYVDAFEPAAGIATLELLERLGVDVTYPVDQTCCGQPMVNSGCHKEASATEALLVRNFAEFDYIVIHSGSCTHQVRCHMTAIPQTPQVEHVRARVYDLVEFLHDVMKVDAFPWARFEHKVSYHDNCNAMRGIFHTAMSELDAPYYSKPRDLLAKVEGLELVHIAGPDECCGFGGTFCVFEPAVSVKMGQDALGQS
jgi:L-lactate dehydrogenase complex protein LldE